MRLAIDGIGPAMSYLSSPRLNFAGRFLSDVSTRNNFADNYEDPPVGVAGWNPVGGGSFEPLGCRVAGAWIEGRSATADPALSYMVSGAPSRPAGKMVDLDPHWQASSELWAFGLRLYDPADGELVLFGEFEPASFRDLFTRQIEREPVNQQAAGGRYVSTLTGVTWGPAADRSPVVRALRAATVEGELSVCLHQFGYHYTETHPRHRTGTLMGSIGPRVAGEPRTAVVARRVLPAAAPGGAVVLGPVDFQLGADRVGLDIGHALLINGPDGRIVDLAPFFPHLGRWEALALGTLPDAAFEFGAMIPETEVTLLGETDVLAPGWYETTGGVVEWPLTSDLRALAGARPLGLYARGGDRRLMALSEETEDGLFLRADSFVRRLDPGDTAEVRFHVRRFGEPLSGAAIRLSDPLTLTGFSSRPGPADALSYPRRVVTDATGQAVLEMAPGAPHERAEIDGGVFGVTYDLDAGPERRRLGLGGLDLVAVHVRTAFQVPDEPEWDAHVRPILAEYGSLYPIMGRHLFDFDDEQEVRRHARHMILAMDRSIDDPNYMPVTRDLSAAKRTTILRWLAGALRQQAAPAAGSTLERFNPVAGGQALPRRQRAHEASAAAAERDGEPPDAKTEAAGAASRLDVKTEAARAASRLDAKAEAARIASRLPPADSGTGSR